MSDDVTNNLAVAENVVTPDWLNRVIERAPSFANEVTNAELGVLGDVLTLEGTVQSEEEKAAIEADFTELAGDNATIVNELVVEAPPEEEVDVEEPEVIEPVVVEAEVEEPEAVAPEVIEPVAVEPVLPVVEAEEAEPEETAPVVVAPTVVEEAAKLSAPELRYDCAGESLRLSGTVANIDSRTLAASAFADKSVENALTLSIETASEDYVERVSAQAARVCGDLGRATINLTNDSLTLSGVTTSNEQRDAIADYVTNALADDVTVINRLTVESGIPYSEDGK